MNGVLIIDKPGGMTSHDVVDRVRQRFEMRRVGHLGTLDPAATGVLPLTLGKATRLARFIVSSPKEYTGKIQLGWETTTCDLQGERLGEIRPVRAGVEAVSKAISGLTGRILQVPPAYSAKKVAGVRAHRLARRGLAVELKAVAVDVETFELVGFEPPLVSFRVVCSAGTYVRSLARDLGRALETGGHLFSLRRTRAGAFEIGQAVSLDQAGPDRVIPPESLMEDLPRFEIGTEDLRRIVNGQAVPCGIEASSVRIFNKKGELIAVASAERGWAHPRVVVR